MEKLQIYNNSVTNKQTRTTKSNIVMGIEVDMKTIAIVITIERDLRPKNRVACPDHVNLTLNSSMSCKFVSPFVNVAK